MIIPFSVIEEIIDRTARASSEVRERNAESPPNLLQSYQNQVIYEEDRFAERPAETTRS